jgi:hypothetical protein
MSRKLVLLACLAATLPARSGSPEEPPAAAPADGHPVVIELFTSQGCASCPPVDRLLTALGEQNAGRVVPLAFHVDLWDYIGWTDPFSKRAWTERQAAYGRQLRLPQVYTPQLIVDGGATIVGSDPNRLLAAIESAARRPAAKISLELEPSASRVLVRARVDVPEALRGRKLDLMIALYETGLVTPVGRGENGGRTLRNDYVVRRLERAGRISARDPAETSHSDEIALDGKWDRSRMGVAGFLQDPRSLEIHGASARPLPQAGGG